MPRREWTPEEAERQRQYRQQDPEKWEAYRRAYYEKNKERYAAHRKAWYAAHPEVKRARDRRNHAQLRQQVLDLMGDCCVRCGFNDPRALHVDHIEGGGLQERREIGNVAALLRKVLKDQGRGYQILCANCNCIKAAENGERRKP
jgi:hypothetical protein